jgi:hypothetical protein
MVVKKRIKMKKEDVLGRMFMPIAVQATIDHKKGVKVGFWRRFFPFIALFDKNTKRSDKK